MIALPAPYRKRWRVLKFLARKEETVMFLAFIGGAVTSLFCVIIGFAISRIDKDK